jgi:hypothetical protein
MTHTRLKIDCIRYDGAAEFAKGATFKAFCVNNRIAMEETAACTHTFNAFAEGAASPHYGLLDRVTASVTWRRHSPDSDERLEGWYC